MGIEKLKSSLLSEAQEDVRKISESAHAQAKSILDGEHSESAAMRKEAETEVARLLEEQRNERLAWARLESRRIASEAREDAIKNVLENFFGALKDARRSPQYRKFLGSAVAAAVRELGDGVTIQIARGDKSLLPEVKGAKVVEDLHGLGGAIVESADRKFRIDLTLETLFEARRDEMRKRIYEGLK
jgi:vacuolar-type H+-ATPase subunit E/Vma4